MRAQSPLKHPAVLAVVILLVAGLITFLIVKSAPRPEKKGYEERVQVVEVRELNTESKRPFWRSGSEVKAAHQSMLTALVSGSLVSVDDQAIPGAWLPKGSELARIDAKDYEFQLQQKLANLIQARADLAIEKGQASLAKEELALSGTKLSKADRALVLREPQISAATAAVKQAKADVDLAKLNLDRTRVVMPFDGQIVQRLASNGSYVNSSASVFEVVDTHEFWLEVKVPQAFMQWIDTTQQVEIEKPGIWGGEKRLGRILNILPSVDATDRQVKVMIAVNDPLGLIQPTDYPILLNDFVEVTVWGKDLDAIHVIESEYLDDDQNVWVVDQANTLQKRHANIVYAGREQVWTRLQVEEGDRLLETRVAVATPGMKVRIQSSSDSASEQASIETTTPALVDAVASGEVGSK